MSDLKFAIEKLKAKLNLPQMIGESVVLTNKGGRHVGLCPFHNEKTPSFYVFDTSYHCFGCGEHGDAIEFVKKTRNLSFIETLEYLSEKYGIELPELKSPQSNSQTNKLKDYFLAFNIAQRLYVNNLHSPAGKKALDYLRGRGFDDEKIKEFGFGLSMNSFNQLDQELRKNNVSARIGQELQLIRPSKKVQGESYDFFRDRLMIPIRDKQGRIIAFGARTLSDDPIKYVNSPNHELFNKKSTLYGLDYARKEAGKKKRVFVTEGYMDVLQLWQQGITECVAVLGTALSAEHLRLLEHVTPSIYLIFDGDAAGTRATLRTVSLSLEFPKMQIKVIQLPSGQDPDSFIRKHSHEEFEKLVGQSQNILHFVLQTELKNVPTLSVPDYIRKTVMPWVRQIKDPLQKNILIGELSKISGINQDKLFELTNLPEQSTGAQNSIKQVPNQSQNESAVSDSLPDRGFLELIGHVFFASAGEIEVPSLKASAANLEITHTWQSSLSKLLDVLDQGVQPASLTTEKLSSLLAGQEIQYNFLESLRKKSKAFETKNRQDSVRLILGSYRTKKNSSSLKDLKIELARVQASKPIDEGQIMQIIKQIEQLTSSGP